MKLFYIVTDSDALRTYSVKYFNKLTDARKYAADKRRVNKRRTNLLPRRVVIHKRKAL